MAIFAIGQTDTRSGLLIPCNLGSTHHSLLGTTIYPFTVEVPISRSQEAMNGMEWSRLDRIAFRLVSCCVAAEREAIWNSISRNNAATMRVRCLSGTLKYMEYRVSHGIMLEFLLTLLHTC